MTEVLHFLFTPNHYFSTLNVSFSFLHSLRFSWCGRGHRWQLSQPCWRAWITVGYWQIVSPGDERHRLREDKCAHHAVVSCHKIHGGGISDVSRRGGDGGWVGGRACGIARLLLHLLFDGKIHTGHAINDADREAAVESWPDRAEETENNEIKSKAEASEKCGKHGSRKAKAEKRKEARQTEGFNKEESSTCRSCRWKPSRSRNSTYSKTSGLVHLHKSWSFPGAARGRLCACIRQSTATCPTCGGPTARQVVARKAAKEENTKENHQTGRHLARQQRRQHF